MTDVPQISPDGREIWDWGVRLSEHIHRMDRIRVLKADINRIKRECGSCEYWMTRACPKEKHDNQRGVSRGPSMGALICDKFIMKGSSAETMSRWEDELKTLEAMP